MTSPDTDIRTHLFYTASLEINTVAERKDIYEMSSDAEIIMEALDLYRRERQEELDSLLAHFKKTNKSAQQIIQSMQTGEYAVALEEIKRCDFYITIISASIARDIRQTGKELLESADGQKGGQSNG